MSTETAKRPCVGCLSITRHEVICKFNVGLTTMGSLVLDSEREREDTLPPGMSTGYENMDDDLDPKEPQ